MFPVRQMGAESGFSNCFYSVLYKEFHRKVTENPMQTPSGGNHTTGTVSERRVAGGAIVNTFNSTGSVVLLQAEAG